jgi:hypothetical protein
MTPAVKLKIAAILLSPFVLLGGCVGGFLAGVDADGDEEVSAGGARLVSTDRVLAAPFYIMVRSTEGNNTDAVNLNSDVRIVNLGGRDAKVYVRELREKLGSNAYSFLMLSRAGQLEDGRLRVRFVMEPTAVSGQRITVRWAGDDYSGVSTYYADGEGFAPERYGFVNMRMMLPGFCAGFAILFLLLGLGRGFRISGYEDGLSRRTSDLLVVWMLGGIGVALLYLTLHQIFGPRDPAYRTVSSNDVLAPQAAPQYARR